MNTALVALELRKNRLTLIGLGASFALVPVLALLVGPRQGLTAAAALESGFVTWTFVGLPFSAILLGATAGAGLRAAENRDAEAPLPGSPLARVLRGALGAALQFLLLTVVTVLIGGVISPGSHANVFGVGEAPKVWAQAAPWRGLIAFFAFELLFSSFVAAYALGHAVAGGLLGSAVSAAQAMAMIFGLSYGMFFGDRVGSFVPLAFLIGGAGLAAKLAALKPLSERFERARPLGLMGALSAGALFLVGALAAAGAQESVFLTLESSLRMSKETANTLEVFLGPSDIDEARALFPAVRRAGALAQEIDGGLDWVSPEGRVKRLIRPVSIGRASPFGPKDWVSETALWDKDGRLFVVRRVDLASGAKTELWLGRPDAGFKQVENALDHPSLERVDGVVHVKGWRSYKDQDCVYGTGGDAICDSRPSTPQLHARDFTPVAEDKRDRFAALDSAGRRREWKLPGRLPSGIATRDIRFPYLVGGKPAWFVPVQRADDQGVAVLHDDGRVEYVWKTNLGMMLPIGGMDLHLLPDGTIVHNYGYDFDVVDPSGQFLPPIKTKKLFERWPRKADAPPHTPVLVRRAGGHAWFVFEGDRLVEMEEGNGMPVRDWPLPVASDAPTVLDGGIVVEAAHGAPYFVAWDGSTHALRAP
jgi:hypothetical protein